MKEPAAVKKFGRAEATAACGSKRRNAGAGRLVRRLPANVIIHGDSQEELEKFPGEGGVR